MSAETAWSVMVGTSWAVVSAADEHDAKLRALARLGRAQRIVDRLARGGERLEADDEHLAAVIAKPATIRHLAAWDRLCGATFAKGGARGRIRHLAQEQAI